MSQCEAGVAVKFIILVAKVVKVAIVMVGTVLEVMVIALIGIVVMLLMGYYTNNRTE